MLAGSMSLGISISVFSLIIYTVVAVLVGIILEFFVFGGDYTRTERLEYEDDDYYYYVKAVPKALVATSERSIKKINGESAREERKSAERVVNYSTPLFQGEEPPKKKKRVHAGGDRLFTGLPPQPGSGVSGGGGLGHSAGRPAAADFDRCADRRILRHDLPAGAGGQAV